MSGERLALAAYVGGAASAELLDLYERHHVEAAVLLRGIDHLPLAALAVDERPTIEALLPATRERAGDGLVTVAPAFDTLGDGHAKLTVYVGRRQRIGGRSAALALVDLLHGYGVAGATAFLGVDGVVRGVRRRASFFSHNADVPTIVVSVGASGPLTGALAEIGSLLDRPLVTLERARVLKRDGELLAEPERARQRLTVLAGEQSRLRIEHEAATALRGLWGHHGDHEPHGDRLLALARHGPVATVIVVGPDEVERMWPVVDAATRTTGLVTSERLIY